MAVSKVNICNMALVQLGGALIESLTASGTTQEEQLCYLFYEEARDYLLRAHPWKFAEVWLSLSELSGEDPEDFTYAYAYPTDCVFLRDIYNSGAAERVKFQVRQDTDGARMIVTDEEDAIAVYTARADDPTKYDVHFRGALSAYLAYLLCEPLDAGEAKKKRMLSAYMMALAQAKASDASEGYTPDESNPLLDARA